jgi:hypothetical protein
VRRAGTSDRGRRPTFYPCPGADAVVSCAPGPLDTLTPRHRAIVQRILIVEDTPEIADALRHHLERKGYATAVATRAAQAGALVASTV